MSAYRTVEGKSDTVSDLDPNAAAIAIKQTISGRRRDSNPRQTTYQAVALPTELRPPGDYSCAVGNSYMGGAYPDTRCWGQTVDDKATLTLTEPPHDGSGGRRAFASARSNLPCSIKVFFSSARCFNEARRFLRVSLATYHSSNNISTRSMRI